MTDLFEDVEEQLRADRYRTLATKGWPWLVGILAAGLIAALGYWGWQSYQTNAAGKASVQFSQALEVLARGEKDQAVKLLGDVAKSPAKGYRSLALMQLAGLQLADNKPQEAVKLFDEAADAAPDRIVGDAARLKSAFALLDTAPYADLEKRLTPLMEDGRPYQIQAREALAFAKLMKGDTAGALDTFKAITQTLSAPDGARQRAQAAVGLIESGSAKALPATAKAAAALPPVQTLPPELLPGASQQGQAPQ